MPTFDPSPTPISVDSVSQPQLQHPAGVESHFQLQLLGPRGCTGVAALHLLKPPATRNPQILILRGVIREL